jgi:peptidoglycan hydrolase FlgJ
MNIQGLPSTPAALELRQPQTAPDLLTKPLTSQSGMDPGVNQSESSDDRLRETFHEFVGQTFFTELIKSYRKTQQAPAYFHGGRAEEIFQSQLDQVLSETLSERTASTIADPMFDLFMMKRQ